MPESKQQRTDQNSNNPFTQSATLILPWLTPHELANISITCKTLYQISKSITLNRSLDASRSLEHLPIPFHNSLHHHHHHHNPYAYFIYTPIQILPHSSVPQIQPRQPWGKEPVIGSTNVCVAEQSRLGERWVSLVDESGESVSGCDCEKCEDVSDDVLCGCPCFGLEGMGIVSECGPSCRCGLDCGNRVTQGGISVRLKIVNCVKKGWGLHADQLIPKGKFVCEYAGELLTTVEARKRQQVYDKLATEGQFFAALLVVREHLPSGKACLRINIDATRVGNVARFINHSCDGGNLSTVLVRSTGSLLPRLCFFASKDIKRDEELSFSYGETTIIRPNGLKCFCGSSCCLGVMPSEPT